MSVIDFAQLEMPASPNTALACSAEICPKADRYDFAPVDVARPVEEIVAALAAAHADAKITRHANGDAQVSYVAVTRIMRFKDDVDILIRPVEDGSSLVAIYSRSRVGYSDFGKNKSRVEDIIQFIKGA